MFKEGFELNVVLRITGLTEQELKDYGVHLEICSQG